MADTPKQIFIKGIWKDNPVFRQVLGICSSLAVTNLLTNTLFMAFGVMFVTAFSNLTVSALRNHIPARIRMIVQVLIIASYVMIVDILIKAVNPDIHRFIGPYVGLIITNCIIMGRMEAFASSNKPLISFWDGLMSGVGYSWILLIIAFFRELLGFGTILGMQVMNPVMHSIGVTDGWIQWSFMIMAPGGFFMLALFIWIANHISIHKVTHSGSQE